MLDNFAAGVDILGVLKEIRKEPARFEEMFLHSASEIEADALIEKIKFTQVNTKMEEKLHNFIRNGSREGNWN